MNRAASLLTLCLPMLLWIAPAAVFLGPLVAEAQTAEAQTRGVMAGVVTDENTKEKIKDAFVILQCACLQGTRETRTNAAGLYSFTNLPPGTYTVQVLVGKADVSKTVTLPRGAKFRANFLINPQNEFKRKIHVAATAVRGDTAAASKISMEEAKNLPVGGSGRDFTSVVDISPTASRDSAGISLAGTTGAESKYTVEGANVTNPAFGTVGATVVQEFVEEVEVLESGYDAEFGGASGGVVAARRVGGTNKVRGQAVFRYTPRLAKPRFIIATDESLRVTEVPDYQLESVVAVTGPIIKDKLFFSVGLNIVGDKRHLVQSFYHRLDKDSSGGYEDCQYENGANDCVKGGNYIASKKFAEQEFNRGNAFGRVLLGLDWIINPKHRLRFTFTGGPDFNRTTYRLPFTSDPNAFGTNPAANPLGGASRIANGIINDAFGWTVAQQNVVALNYQGRVADDKLEIDAGIAYVNQSFQEAWRLDNPELKNIPATQQQDNQGKNLYELLDADQAVGLVSGARTACNATGLPGLACPTRRWISGGIGEYDRATQHRVGGELKLTHFFNALGSHQLKYGTLLEHLAFQQNYAYSGETSKFDNQPGGCNGKNGGEWCYEDGEYNVSMQPRVNNHRYIVVNTDNPDIRATIGFGRARHEQDDLRAIATDRGHGARVNAYDETTSTQNYAVFLQDKWAILSNLYLNAGVRWEVQDMRDILGNRAMLIWDNVAPRIGLVYDWTDEGRSRLYASYGWFYQQLPLQLNNRVFGGLVDVRRTYRNSDCEGKSTTIAGPNGEEGFQRTRLGQPTEWCTDIGAVTTGLTTGSIVPKLKGQYNEQFQVGYEQEVIEDLVLGVQWLHTDLGRAVEDVSVNDGQTFFVANPGVAVDGDDIRSKLRECREFERLRDEARQNADPNDDSDARYAREADACNRLVDGYQKINERFSRPTRNYDAWTFRVQKRFAKNWLLLASYTYSRLIGNYDGFVDPINGSINIGASTQYDLPELVRNSFGPLAFNQPHRFKLDGFYSFDLQEAGRLTLGTSLRVNSGFAVNIRADNNRYFGQYLVYVLPRGSGGRIEPNYQWNLSVGYAYPLPGELELEFVARLFNVTNAKAVLRVDEVYSFSATRPIPGGDLGDLKHAKVQNPSNPTDFFQPTILQPQGNYGVETQFQQPLSAQFELRLRF